ncbi:MarR family winged helix-turn-helix transcriptional regulator [Streptomyces sp. NPDC048383]|uniref:MarR family winged helix-turn-helix transcriptional regulator n=1 Tax=Streptomyces sp. NPDC048383 TaxID=3155386 RepID=UPI0034307A3C
MTEETRPADPPRAANDAADAHTVQAIRAVLGADEVAEVDDVNDVNDVTHAVLAASDLLASISARALAAAGDGVTPAQFRMLDVLVARRHVKLVSLAGLMEVNPSTAMRMVDRLIAAGLADRRPNRENRRETVLTATDSGSRLVKAVTARRRAETSAVLARLGPVERTALVGTLAAFAAAAGLPTAPAPHALPPLAVGRPEDAFPG